MLNRLVEKPKHEEPQKRQKTKRYLSRSEIQAHEQEMLQSLDAFCRKHNIRYTLLFGSMLGAVRHGGLYLGTMTSTSAFRGSTTQS